MLRAGLNRRLELKTKVLRDLVFKVNELTLGVLEV